MRENLDTRGYFNYMSADCSSSLYRNGKVYTKRDINGSDAGSEGINLEKCEKLVINARELFSKNISLNTNGFELFNSSLDKFQIDFFNNEQVLNKYYIRCANEIKDFTGATEVYAFDHNIRSASGKKKKQMIHGGQQVQGPARIVHGDYTLTSASERIRQLSKPPSKNDTLSKIIGEKDSLIPSSLVDSTLSNGRFAIINLWRSIVVEPVEMNPIALCDAQTVTAEDLVVFEIHYSDRIGENYFAKHNDKHKWYYYPNINKDEALLIKQWDSNGGLAVSSGKTSDFMSKSDTCTFSFHSAFHDPNTRVDAPDRCSIEVRCIVIY